MLEQIQDTNDIFAQLTHICGPCIFGGDSFRNLTLPVKKSARFVKVWLPGTQTLHFNKLELFLEGQTREFLDYTLTASSIHPPAHPQPVTNLGLGLHTANEKNPYVQLDLGTTRPLETIRIRNRKDLQAKRNWSLRVELSEDGHAWHVLHNHRSFVDETEKIARNFVAYIKDATQRTRASAYLDGLIHWLRGNSITRKVIEDQCAARGLDMQVARHVEKQINENVMFDFGHEITGHGIHKTFRFWGDEDIREYLTKTMDVCHHLQEISPFTCVGYGGVLGYVRDGKLIPHDDDLDLIIGFKRSDETPTIAAALAKTEAFLRTKGWNVSGDMLSHRWVKVWRERNIDVFVGLIKDEFTSFFPGPRRHILTEQVFPTIAGKICGVDLLLPRNPFHYIEKVYGESWRTPQTGFKHVWTSEHFKDILK